jgi:hypothetical protein
VLAERGLSTEGHTPSLLTFEGVQDSDVVITMGCGETCPVFPGTRYEDWEVEDPKGQELDVVRRIVDDVDGRVRALLADPRRAGGELSGQASLSDRSWLRASRAASTGMNVRIGAASYRCTICSKRDVTSCSGRLSPNSRTRSLHAAVSWRRSSSCHGVSSSSRR